MASAMRKILLAAKSLRPDVAAALRKILQPLMCNALERLICIDEAARKTNLSSH